MGPAPPMQPPQSQRVSNAARPVGRKRNVRLPTLDLIKPKAAVAPMLSFAESSGASAFAPQLSHHAEQAASVEAGSAIVRLSRSRPAPSCQKAPRPEWPKDEAPPGTPGQICRGTFGAGPAPTHCGMLSSMSVGTRPRWSSC
jgi:hypothetical protein